MCRGILNTNISFCVILILQILQDAIEALLLHFVVVGSPFSCSLLRSLNGASPSCLGQCLLRRGACSLQRVLTSLPLSFCANVWQSQGNTSGKNWSRNVLRSLTAPTCSCSANFPQSHVLLAIICGGASGKMCIARLPSHLPWSRILRAVSDVSSVILVV